MPYMDILRRFLSQFKLKIGLKVSKEHEIGGFGTYPIISRSQKDLSLDVKPQGLSSCFFVLPLGLLKRELKVCLFIG